MFKESDVFKKIKKSCVKKLVISFLLLCFFLIILIGCIEYNLDEVSMWFGIIIGGIGSIYNLCMTIKNLMLVLNDNRLEIFNRIESIEKLTEIINSTYANKVYEDDEIILSSEYLIPKKFWELTTKITDIVWVYEFAHDKYTQFGKKKIQRVLNIYTFNNNFGIPYDIKSESQIQRAIYRLQKIKSSIIIGYTSNSKEQYRKIINTGYINRKVINCEVCGKETEYNEYGTCEECHKIIMERLKKKEEQNKNMNEKGTEEEKNDDKFVEIKKYKELLEEGVITQEEFDKKKKELLNL